MAITRDILKHVKAEVAERQRKCHHSRGKHAVAKGDSVLAVYDERGGRKNYCRGCAPSILERAAEKLKNLRELVGGKAA